MTIGERIKLRREELGLTQGELAKKCGYKSRSSINKIELSRSLPLKKVELMAKALETTPSKLMGWSDEDDEETIFEYVPDMFDDFGTIDEADELYDKYIHAIPEIRKAVDSLLNKHE